MAAEARNVIDNPHFPRRYRFRELKELYAKTDGFLAITPGEFQSMHSEIGY